jgi:hypothetical protein
LAGGDVLDHALDGLDGRATHLGRHGGGGDGEALTEVVDSSERATVAHWARARVKVDCCNRRRKQVHRCRGAGGRGGKGVCGLVGKSSGV